MSLKILLADDSPTAQNMGKKILTDAGYQVIPVSNGAQAFKKIAEHHPDLLILDIFMPGYTGLEVCDRIKSAPESARTPVLLSVGKMEPFRPEDGQRVRADGVIVKPFEATELVAAVERAASREVELPESHPEPVHITVPFSVAEEMPEAEPARGRSTVAVPREMSQAPAFAMDLDEVNGGIARDRQLAPRGRSNVLPSNLEVMSAAAEAPSAPLYAPYVPPPRPEPDVVAAPEKDVTTEKDAIPHYQPDPEDGPRFATQREPAEVDQADEPYFAMQPDAFEVGLHDQPAFAVQPGAVEPDAEDEPLFSIQPATAAAEGQPAAVAGNDHEPLFSFPAEAREAEEDEPFFALQAEAAASASSADDLASPVQGVPGAIPGSLVPEDVFSGSELAEPIAEGEQGEAVSVGLPQTEDSWPPQSELPPEPVGNDVAENIVQVAEPAPWDAGIAEDRAHLNAADREWGLAEEMPAPIGLAEPPPAEMAAADLTQLDSIEGAELAFEAAPAAEAPTELIQAIVAEAWERTEPAAEHLSEKAPAYDANPATEQNGEFPATPEISHAQNADWIVGEMQVSGEEKSLSLAQEMRKALLAAAAAAKAILGVTPAAEEHAEFETEPEPATFDHPEPIVLPELVEPVVVTVSDEPPSPPEVLDPCGEDHAELYASVDQGAPAEAAGDAAAAPAPARQAERLLDEDTINQVVQRVMERMQPTLIAEITRELSQKRRKYSKEEEH